MRYFNHDTNAAADELMIQLRLEHGSPAIDAYWVILEYLYGEEKPLPFGRNQRETKSVLFRLSMGFEELETYVKTMVEIGLLISRKSPTNDFDFIASLRANEQIEEYKARAETARQNGKKGGRPKKPSRFSKKTQSVSSSVSEKNQREKLTKTKTKRVGFDKQNQTLKAGAGADGDKPAPHASDGGMAAIAFINSLTDDEVRQYHSMSKAERDTFEQRKLMEDMTANAVNCPDHIAQQVRGGVA